MRFVSLATVASRVESFLGSAVAALEREEREEEFRFQMVDLGGEYRPFSFHDEDVNGLCAGCGLGELPKFEIRYFQYPLSNA